MLEYKKVKRQTRRVMNIARREAREQFVSTITDETPSQQIWLKICQILGKRKTHQIKKLKNTDGRMETSYNGKHPSQTSCRDKFEHTIYKSL
jgi:ribosomal protein RSM22 (predicted rRNA methylase)